MNPQKVIREFIEKQRRIPELGEYRLMHQFVREEEGESDYFLDLPNYGRLLALLPDKVVENLEKARLAGAGQIPMIKAGLGYEELLSSIIVDGTAIASSSAEARLSPAIVIPRNYMAPGGIPGRTLRFKMRGRVTTLTTAATMTFRQRIATTDVITGTALQATGAITQDTTAQTNTMWEWEGHVICRSVGATGTVFAMGDAGMASQANTVANTTAVRSGSAGSATPAAVTYDTTVDQYLQVTGQWSLATAYSIQAHIYILEALN